MNHLQILGITSTTLAELVAGTIPANTREARRAEALLSIVREAGTMAYANKERINSPRVAGAYLLRRCIGWTEERFGLLALNSKGDLLGDAILSQGTATATLISPREFFRAALRMGATSVLAYHNHPSGNPDPSREDISLTKRLRAAGESLGVPLADHIIAGSDTFYSFRAAEGWDNA